MIVSAGKYLMRAFSTNSVKVESSSTACARACFAKEVRKKRVMRCFVIVVIVSILHVVEVVVNEQ